MISVMLEWINEIRSKRKEKRLYDDLKYLEQHLDMLQLSNTFLGRKERLREIKIVIKTIDHFGDGWYTSYTNRCMINEYLIKLLNTVMNNNTKARKDSLPELDNIDCFTSLNDQIDIRLSLVKKWL